MGPPHLSVPDARFRFTARCRKTTAARRSASPETEAGTAFRTASSRRGAVGDHGVVDRVPITAELRRDLVDRATMTADLHRLPPPARSVHHQPRRRNRPNLVGPRPHRTRPVRTRPPPLMPHQPERRLLEASAAPITFVLALIRDPSPIYRASADGCVRRVSPTSSSPGFWIDTNRSPDRGSSISRGALAGRDAPPRSGFRSSPGAVAVHSSLSCGRVS